MDRPPRHHELSSHVEPHKPSAGPLGGLLRFMVSIAVIVVVVWSLLRAFDSINRQVGIPGNDAQQNECFRRTGRPPIVSRNGRPVRLDENCNVAGYADEGPPHPSRMEAEHGRPTHSENSASGDLSDAPRPLPRQPGEQRTREQQSPPSSRGPVADVPPTPAQSGVSAGVSCYLPSLEQVQLSRAACRARGGTFDE